MEIKNLLLQEVKEETISRINKLVPATQRKWGTMEVAQMLAHLQARFSVAFGSDNLKGNFFIRLFGPLLKGMLYSEKPYRKNMPTDKSFKISDHREFAKEKQQLLEMIYSFSEETLRKDPHPYFGKLTQEQWGKASWKHIDHHLRQFGV
jgi:hypothetical protein